MEDDHQRPHDGLVGLDRNPGGLQQLARLRSTTPISSSTELIGRMVSKFIRRFSAALISLTPWSEVLEVATRLKPSRA